MTNPHLDRRGTLSLQFDDPSATTLTIEPAAAFEAWTYWDGNGLLVCEPGGSEASTDA